MNTSILIKTSISILAVSIIAIMTLQAQNCETDEDLLHDQGTLSDHKKSPLQGFISDFTPAEKTVALKTLNAIESHCIKDFTIQGGDAQAWFSFNEAYYFDTWLHKSYEYKIGFYQFVCVNGKRLHSSEFISDFEITANPSIPCFFNIPSEFESSNSFFDADRTKNAGPRIAVFRYLVFTNSDFADVINNGNGCYEDDKNDIYNNRRDIYRIWYITHPGKKMFTEVSRKEYLNSLLEYYEREKFLLTKRNDTKIAEAKKYMAEYEKSGNKAMYQSNFEDLQAAQNERTELANRYTTKKDNIINLLNSKPGDWLQQTARIDPKMRDNGYCSNNNDYSQSGYFTFGGFCEDENAAIVYKWNSDYFDIQLQSLAEPLFFKVAFRYKANTPFTLNIKDNFVEKFDLEGIKKLVILK
jgi:hypothetical protein